MSDNWSFGVTFNTEGPAEIFAGEPATGLYKLRCDEASVFKKEGSDDSSIQLELIVIEATDKDQKGGRIVDFLSDPAGGSDAKKQKQRDAFMKRALRALGYDPEKLKGKQVNLQRNHFVGKECYAHYEESVRGPDGTRIANSNLTYLTKEQFDAATNGDLKIQLRNAAITGGAAPDVASGPAGGGAGFTSSGASLGDDDPMGGNNGAGLADAPTGAQPSGGGATDALEALVN